MVAMAEAGNLPERLRPQRAVLMTCHAYQPDREEFLPASGKRLSVVPQVNEEIYQQVYKPIFVESDSYPEGMTFSFYRALRDWFKEYHPAEFGGIVEKVNAIPDKEYKVLGDPFMHAILPLLPRADQDMLVKLGKQAFKDDFGFEPKGMWLPETAVSKETLEVLADNGYEFVVLRNTQLKNSDENPMQINLGEGRKIAVVHFASDVSGSLSFDPNATENADEFLNRYSGPGSQIVSAGSDIETFGHHKKDRDKFLKYLLKPNTLAMHGFAPFDVKKALKGDLKETEVYDNSSWSCDHNLGRWKGECGCDGAGDRANSDKKNLYQALTKQGTEINSMLDESDPNWRVGFIDFFLAHRDQMFSHGDQAPVTNDLLYWAKICELVGRTSCGWFFGNEVRVEREIPGKMIGEIKVLMERDSLQRTIFEPLAA